MPGHTLYICTRPETTSKQPHAKCRQYCFDTTAELLKWLRARKNSREWIGIHVIVDSRDVDYIDGRRCDLAQETEWPLP